MWRRSIGNEHLGANLCVDDSYVKPTVLRLAERQYLGCVFTHVPLDRRTMFEPTLVSSRLDGTYRTTG